MITLDEGGAARTAVRFTPVPPPLRDCVEHAWVMGPSRSERPWRIVPDAAAYLLWHLEREGRFSVRVVGPRTRYVDLDPRSRIRSGGFRLRPGALSRLIELPSWELRDRSISAQTAWGREADPVIARAHEVADDARHVNRILAGLLKPHGEVEWRARGLLDHVQRTPRTTVAKVARRLGVGERGLRAASRATFGLRPKELHRLLRLQRGLGLLLQNRPTTTVAAEAGYADQSHFIRESVAILGETPTRFRDRGAMPKSSRHTTDVGPIVGP